MKRTLYLVLSGLMLLFFLGMGKDSGKGIVFVPEPEDTFLVSLVDSSGFSINLDKFSFDGHTKLTGSIGKIDISIPFEKIRTIDFLKEFDHMKAYVKLKSGEQLEVAVKNSIACYGISSFADVRIETGDIKQIKILTKSKK